MYIMFSKTFKDGPQAERAMICTMILPHFLLARSKSENDGKISNALKSLSDDAKGGVFSTLDKVIMKGRYCTLLNLL